MSTFLSSVYRGITFRDVSSCITGPVGIDIVHPVPYESKSIYRMGQCIINETVPPFDDVTNLIVIPDQSYPGEQFISVLDHFPFPVKTTEAVLSIYDSYQNFISAYTISQVTEPLIKSSSKRWYTVDTETLNPLMVAEIEKRRDLMSRLKLFSNNTITFSNTGDLWKYGLVSLMSILTSSNRVKVLLDIVDTDDTYIEAYREEGINRTWREKDLNSLYQTISGSSLLVSIRGKYKTFHSASSDQALLFCLDVYKELNTIYKGL